MPTEEITIDDSLKLSIARLAVGDILLDHDISNLVNGTFTVNGEDVHWYDYIGFKQPEDGNELGYIIGPMNFLDSLFDQDEQIEYDVSHARPRVSFLYFINDENGGYKPTFVQVSVSGDVHINGELFNSDKNYIDSIKLASLYEKMRKKAFIEPFTGIEVGLMHEYINNSLLGRYENPIELEGPGEKESAEAYSKVGVDMEYLMEKDSLLTPVFFEDSFENKIKHWLYNLN